MQTKHTPGRLFYWPNRNCRLQVGPSTNYTVAEMCITPLEGQYANALRLVACWNACDGISTETLEASDNMAEFARRMLIQRDELLAICQSVVENGIGASDLAAMRAAIAKVKGGAA